MSGFYGPVLLIITWLCFVHWKDTLLWRKRVFVYVRNNNESETVLYHLRVVICILNCLRHLIKWFLLGVVVTFWIKWPLCQLVYRTVMSFKAEMIDLVLITTWVNLLNINELLTHLFLNIRCFKYVDKGEWILFFLWIRMFYLFFDRSVLIWLHEI